MAVQTVLVERTWQELQSGFDRLQRPVFHVVLDVGERALLDRIGADTVETEAAAWRLAHVDDFRAARRWMTAAADLVVDVTDRDPAETVTAIVPALRRHAERLGRPSPGSRRKRSPG